MSTIDPSQLTAADLSNPALSAQDLADITAARPDLRPEVQEEIQKDLARSIRVNARPLTDTDRWDVNHRARFVCSRSMR